MVAIPSSTALEKASAEKNGDALRNAAIVGLLVLCIGLPMLFVPTEPGPLAEADIAWRTRILTLLMVALAVAAGAYVVERRNLAGLRAAGQAALLTAGIGMPILAILTDQSRGTNLDLVARFGLVGIASGLAFLGGWLAHIYTSLGRQRFFSSENIAGAAVVLAILSVLGFAKHWAIGATLLALAGFLVQMVTSRTLATNVPGFAEGRARAVGALREASGRVTPPTLLLLALLFPMLAISLTGWAGALKWIDNFGVQILIFVMLGWGLNIVVGLAGLLDLGYVAFYAVGAYSYALIAKNGMPLPVFSGDFPFLVIDFVKLGAWGFWVLLPVSGLLAALWGVLLGFPVLRLRGDYLAIVTLAFGEIIRLVLINWQNVTNGTAGITNVPGVSLLGIPLDDSKGGLAALLGFAYHPLHERILLYYLILALALLTAAVTVKLRAMPVGRAWEALREDEIACRSLGINTVNTKLTAFAIGAMFAGFAGSFFAARQGFINPESFTFDYSAQVLAIVILGGAGSLVGVVIAAVAIVGGFELLRELDFLKEIFGQGFDPTQYRALIFGLCMVLMMIVRPRGLISTREPTLFLKERKAIGAEHVKEGHG